MLNKLKIKINKIKIAWFILMLLLLMIVYLNYVKFVSFYTYEVEEIEESSNEAIDIALTDIVNIFNNSEDIANYKNQGINISALSKTRSIYISYSKDTTTTYKFNYDALTLNINIKNEEDNLNLFNTIYRILIKSIQSRIQNENNDIDDLINLHINDNIDIVGLEKKDNPDNTISYKIDITKKLKKESR